MIRYSLGTALAAALFWMQADAASAQNSTDPGTGSTNPSTGSAPATPTPPPAPAPAPPAPAPAETAPTRTEIVPVPVPVASTPPATIELQDQPYPNGFADPNAAFGNDLSVQVREQDGGFDWGLLGLLGLIGLLGLRRPRDGYRHVVQSERYDDGRPPRV
jgi:MYXO-CTERM domain-containing protein